MWDRIDPPVNWRPWISLDPENTVINESRPTAVGNTADLTRHDRLMVKAIAWTGVANWSAQILTWLSTIVIARLLSPSDYGIMGMASIYLGLVTMISEFGIGAAVIQLRNLDDDQLSQLNTMALIIGLGCFILSVFASAPLGYFFNSPELPTVVVAMSLTFIIAAFKTTPDSILQKELRFKLLAYLDAIRALVQAVTTVCFAAAGYKYWSLVMGAIVGSLVSTGLTLYQRRVSFSWPRLTPLRLAIEYSRHIIISRISWYTYSNSDLLVAGRVFGQEPLGVYSLSWYFANTHEKISILLNRVVPSFLSAVQNEPAAIRRYLLNLTEALALTTFPISVGIALVAPELVRAVLGPKWEAAVVPITLLSLYACIRVLTPLLSNTLNATGQSKFGMQIMVVSAIIFPIAFYLASRWGIVGIATVWVIVHPFLALPLFLHITKTINLSVKSYFRSLQPAMTGCILMAIAVLLMRRTLPIYWVVWIRFGIMVLTGALIYALTLLTLHKNRMIKLYHVLKLARE